MNFAENNRISHRQLYRQMVLTFLAPFLLCLFGERRILGMSGIIGVLAALVILGFYVIFLIRLTPCYEDIQKVAGVLGGRIVGVFFLIYIILTGVYLLVLLEDVVTMTLLQGFPGKAVSVLAVIICCIGTHRGMQRRGRVAEVSGGLLLGALVLLMILCLGQGKLSYLQEMIRSSVVTTGSVARGGYGILCAFAGIGLLPFVLQDVEKQGSAGKTIILGILTLGGILVGLLFLLPTVFGWERLRVEEYPVLPLLAGANLPGNVLARFDILWIGFLVYSLLFAIGSLFHYGYQIMRLAGLYYVKERGISAKKGTGGCWSIIGKLWLPGVIYFLSVIEVRGLRLEDFYGKYLGYVFVPGMILIQVFLMAKGKKRYKKKISAMAMMFAVAVLLGGCSGVEPEKRMFPLALGVDVSDLEPGSVFQYSLILGMPDLPQATGQEKPEEGSSSSVLKLKGETFADIEMKYNRSQEKYLDLGHLQVLLVGNNFLMDQKWEVILEYLKKEPLVGENVYLFRTQNPEAVMSWKGGSGTSIGEYLTGILENRTTGQQKTGVTLRQAYHEWYKNNVFVKVPEVVLENEQIEILFE